ncbi:MAG: DUF2029 domain-containing protein [Chloroflexi bacterium]|nr:DUF2029 domain-containing protein [Chloroflexota bacterium]
MLSSFSKIRSRPKISAPIGLAVVAFGVYVAHIHFRGYGGDPNLYYDAARNSEWFVRPLHFGYVALLDLVFTLFGPAVSNLYFLQGLLSAFGGAISVWLITYIVIHSDRNNTRLGAGLLAGTFFAFSGGILITANYGETYMLQILFILGAAACVLRRSFLIAGLLTGWTITFTPLSLLLMPIILVTIGIAVISGGIRLNELAAYTLGVILALLTAAGVVAIYDPAAFSSWANSGSTSVFGFEGRGPAQYRFVFVQVAWLARGFHIAGPLVLIGILVIVVNKERVGLLFLVAAIVTLIVNLPVMVRVDDYWRMMMITNVYLAYFVSIGLMFILRRVGVNGFKKIATAAVAMIIFSAISLADMPRRENAVSSEIHAVYRTIRDIETSALVISLWENIASTDHYAENDGRDTLPELLAFPPIQNWQPPPDGRQLLADAKAAETPIYVVIRERRYDSPLMRTIFGTIDTGHALAYQSILKQFRLNKLGPVGKYHALYSADPL